VPANGIDGEAAGTAHFSWAELTGPVVTPATAWYSRGRLLYEGPWWKQPLARDVLILWSAARLCHGSRVLLRCCWPCGTPTLLAAGVDLQLPAPSPFSARRLRGRPPFEQPPLWLDVGAVQAECSRSGAGRHTRGPWRPWARLPWADQHRGGLVGAQGGLRMLLGDVFLPQPGWRKPPAAVALDGQTSLDDIYAPMGGAFLAWGGAFARDLYRRG